MQDNFNVWSLIYTVTFLEVTFKVDKFPIGGKVEGGVKISIWKISEFKEKDSTLKMIENKEYIGKTKQKQTNEKQNKKNMSYA